MGAAYPEAVERLIDQLGMLPGVGPKSAERVAFYLLKVPTEDALKLSRAIEEVKAQVVFCERCFNFAASIECRICGDPQRDAGQLCVVEEPRDVSAIERTREFRGRYHVLHGAIDHLRGIGPDQLKVRELLLRINDEGVEEIILCTNPNIEGEATAMYLARLMADLGVRITRIASGLPVGGDLEYADELTLGRALEGRREVVE